MSHEYGWNHNDIGSQFPELRHGNNVAYGNELNYWRWRVPYSAQINGRAQQHHNNSSNNNNIACRLCDQIFMTTQDLINHVESHMRQDYNRSSSSSMVHPRNHVGSNISFFPLQRERINNFLSPNPIPSLPPSPPAAVPTPPLLHLNRAPETDSSTPYYFLQAEERGEVMKKDVFVSDPTMPFLSLLEQPIPESVRLAKNRSGDTGGGGDGDGFDKMDLTLKL